MKFCERFHLTVFEYRSMPAGIVQTWSQMSNIENESKKATASS